MRAGTAIMAALAVLALAWWAYQENYRTRAAVAERGALRAEIAALERTLDLLDREWAYLNRPERLQDLAEINYVLLELEPMTPAAFGTVDEVPTPGELIVPEIEGEAEDGGGAELAGAGEEWP